MINRLPIRFSKNKISKLQVLVASMLAIFASSAQAVDIEKRIIVNAEVLHDSNPAMTDGSKDPTWIYSLTPQFQLDAKDDLNRWYLDALLLVQRHSNENVLVNREDPKLTLGWDRLYESGMFGIKVDYKENSARLTEINNSGAFTSIDNTEKTKSLYGKWQYDFAPKWSVLTETGYNDVTYSANGLLDDYQLSEVKSKLTYDYTETLKTYVSIGYMHLNPDNNLKNTDLSRIALGADYQVNEALTLYSRVGIHDLSGHQSDSDWDAALKADYVSDKMLYSAIISRDFAAYGIGFRKIDSVKLSGQYKLTDNDSLGAEYTFDQYKKDNDINIGKLNSQSLGAFYERRITDHWRARLSGSHKKLDIVGSHPTGNLIGVSLVYDTLSF
jgi:hypothetical protein